METDLAEIQSAVDQYFGEHLHQFDPFDWKNPETTKIRRKALSELGLYLYVVERYGGSAPDVREHVAEQVSDPQYPKLLRRHPGKFSELAFPAIAMRETGDLPTEVTRAIEDTLRRPHMWGRERRPFELVVLLSQCRLWGCDRRGPDLSSALETANLANPPDVVAAGQNEFYALAHNVMFPTFFGTGHPDLLEPPLPYDLERAVTGGLLRYMADGNADAVVELLITGVLQRQLPERLLQYAVRWLCEEKTTDEYVASPTGSDSEGSDSDASETSRSEILRGFSRTTDSDDEWSVTSRTWSKHYHTNVVAGILVSVLEGTDEFSTRRDRSVSLSSDEFRNALKLGDALNEFESYDLAGAAETLTEIPPETFARFPGVSRRVVTFLENQRSGDSFGYWVDERRLYERNAGDDADFEAELVVPLTEQCHTALEHVSSELSETTSNR